MYKYFKGLFGSRSRRSENISFETGPEAKKESLPINREIATAVDDIYGNWRTRQYNPDELATVKGGLRIYKTMAKDEQVKACLALKKNAITGRGWEIQGGEEEHIEFMQEVFEGMEGSVEDVVTSILSSLQYGFSVHEKVYKLIESGKWKGKIGYRALKQKSPTRLEFRADKYGNLLPNGLIQLTDEGESRPLPVDKFVIHSYQKEFGNFYGESDLKAAYRPWFMKDNFIKYWAIFLERYAIPVPYAKPEEGRQMAPDTKSTINNVLKKLMAGTAMVIPDGVDIAYFSHEGSRGVSDLYEKAVKLMNTLTARAILVPSMVGYTDQEQTGALAQAETHFSAFEFILNMIVGDLEETVFLEQICKPLIIYNFGEQEEYASLKFNPMSDDKRMELLSAWSDAVQKGSLTSMPEDEEFMRDVLRLPEMDATEIQKRKDDAFERMQASKLAGQGDNRGEDVSSQDARFTEEEEAEIILRKINYRTVLEAMDGLEEDVKVKMSQAFAESIEALITDIKKKSTSRNELH